MADSVLERLDQRLSPEMIDLRRLAGPRRDGLLFAGDALAECLERFLSARADEPTMQRARAALDEWRQASSPLSV
jgi:hypothetical protein